MDSCLKMIVYFFIYFFYFVLQSNDAGMESPEANFAKLTQSLITDPVEREHFVQVSSCSCQACLESVLV